MLIFLALTLLTSEPADARVDFEPAPRSLAASLYRAEEAESAWTGSTDVGGSISSGNSAVITAAVGTEAQKSWDDHRLTLKAAWVFAQQEDKTSGSTEVTQRRWNGSAKFDHFYNEQTFSFVSVSGENDDLADLHLRSIYSLGGGRKIWDEEGLLLEGEAGIAYVDENYFSTLAPAKDADDDFLALRLAYKLEKSLFANTTFLQTMEALPSLGFSEVNGTLDSRVRIQLSEAMHAQVQWIARYNNNAPSGTGSTDALWLFSLGWTY